MNVSYINAIQATCRIKVFYKILVGQKYLYVLVLNLDISVYFVFICLAISMLLNSFIVFTGYNLKSKLFCTLHTPTSQGNPDQLCIFEIQWNMYWKIFTYAVKLCVTVTVVRIKPWFSRPMSIKSMPLFRPMILKQILYRFRIIICTYTYQYFSSFQVTSLTVCNEGKYTTSYCYKNTVIPLLLSQDFAQHSSLMSSIRFIISLFCMFI